MKYKQELIAENLFQNLNIYFKKIDKPVKIKIEGLGVHWHCEVSFSNQNCKIHCFENYNCGENSSEYLICFKKKAKEVAWGRTKNLEEVLSSCNDWILKKTLEYNFIDKDKQLLKEIDLKLIEYQPELKKAKMKIQHSSCDIYHYFIRNKDRSCKLCSYGENVPIGFIFSWDSCHLFQVNQNDLSKMALVIKRWLIDYVNPSALEQEIPWVEVGSLAKYYERGERLKGEFIESWNDLEQFYERFRSSTNAQTEQVISLIKEIRKRGYDETLRAGQSLYNMVLSRSRRHGLGNKQKALVFSFYDEAMVVTNEEEKEFKFEKIEFTENLEKLLQELEKVEIETNDVMEKIYKKHT